MVGKHISVIYALKDGSKMLKKIIIKKVDNIISQFPLKKEAKILPNSRLCDTINLFGSLLSERVKARLLEEFPNHCFDKISAFTTLEEIYNLIINSKNLNDVGKKLNLVKNLSFKDDILEQTNQNINSTGIDIETRSSMPENIFEISSLKLRKRLFTINEVTYSLTKPDPLMTLLGIFSAKESIIKAIFFKKKIKYTDIEIKYSSEGKPFPLINKIYDSNLQISISHCENIVISNCIYFKS